MSHSFCRIWIHAVWGTKVRTPFITPTIEPEVYSFMYGEPGKLDCPARIINGMPDHLHLLFLPNPRQALSDVVKQLKGACSGHINRVELTPERFSWQTGYSAFSVSESMVDRVFHYIRRQKQHHKRQTLPMSMMSLSANTDCGRINSLSHTHQNAHNTQPTLSTMGGE